MFVFIVFAVILIAVEFLMMFYKCRIYESCQIFAGQEFVLFSNFFYFGCLVLD